MMKLRIGPALFICMLLVCTSAFGAEPRTYRQFRDVSVREKGDVRQSGDKANLFEFTYSIDINHRTITRTKVRRLDWITPEADSTVYTLMEKQRLFVSDAGNGGDVFVGVRKNGSETIVLGRRFAFTMRISPFSQVITGVYKRMYDWDEYREKHHEKHH